MILISRKILFLPPPLSFFFSFSFLPLFFFGWTKVTISLSKLSLLSFFWSVWFRSHELVSNQPWRYCPTSRQVAILITYLISPSVFRLSLFDHHQTNRYTFCDFWYRNSDRFTCPVKLTLKDFLLAQNIAIHLIIMLFGSPT